MNENKKQIRLLLFITFLFWFSQYTYIPNFSPYLLSLGASHKITGIIIGSYGFAQIIIRLPLGLLADRISKNKIFIVAGLIFSLVSVCGFLLFPYVGAALLFRFLAGVSVTSWIAFTVLFCSYYEAHDTVKAMSIIFGFNYLGQIAAMVTGSFAANNYSQDLVFLIAMIGAAVGLILSRNLNETKISNKQPIAFSKQLRFIVKDKNLISVSLLAILYQVAMYATVYGFTPAYAKGLGANELQLGLLSVLSVLPIAVASLLSGLLFTQRSERNLVVIGFIIVSSATLLIPLISDINQLYLSQFFGSFGRGIIFPILMGLSIKKTPYHQRSTSMGFFQAVYGFGMVLGPVIVGFLTDNFDMGLAFIVCGLIALLGAILSIILIRTS